MAGPRHSHRAPPKASAAAIHSALDVAAARNPMVFLVSARSTAMSTAKTANVLAQMVSVIAADVPPRPATRTGSASQRGQYLVSGVAASSPAGIADPHCSQDPKRPAASRPRASSRSASFLRAATVRRSRARISGSSSPSPVPPGAAAAATW